MKIHIIAIGGSIMHNLAIDLKNNGHTVSGSDDEIHEPSYSKLKKHGLLPEKTGWFPDKITPDTDIVILGMHARSDNPELLQAQALNLTIYSYPEFIYQNSISKKRIVIGGSHGKTTITSMILHVLKKNNYTFDYLVGAQLDGFDTMVKITNNNPVLVAEGDEYLASPIDLRPKFLIYRPHIAVISGIAWDHVNVFPTFQKYKQAFADFINTIQPGGTLIYNSEDHELTELVHQNSRENIHLIPYTSPVYEIHHHQIHILQNNQSYPVHIFGKHNLQNLEAAKAVCHLLNITDEQFYQTIQDFKGAAKRLEKWIDINNILVFRDFAHAPSKVKATIDAVKETYPDKKIIAALELHTFSSLNENFLNQYQNTLQYADVKIVYYDAHTLEMKKMPPLNKNKITDAFKDKDILVIDNKPALIQTIQQSDIQNNVLLLMSSGTFSQLTKEEILSITN